MPKKKLTKAQVKRKLKTIDNTMASMIIDKVEQPDSHVSMSLPLLLETSKKFRNALRRVK
jgi:hypothetical protein